MYKKYVDVITLIDKEGNVTPRTLCWDNGVTYDIDRIVDIRKSASQVGGCGIRFQCRIEGVMRNLFYERNRWFIESKRP